MPQKHSAWIALKHHIRITDEYQKALADLAVEITQLAADNVKMARELEELKKEEKDA